MTQGAGLADRHWKQSQGLAPTYQAQTWSCYYMDGAGLPSVLATTQLRPWGTLAPAVTVHSHHLWVGPHHWWNSLPQAQPSVWTF